MPNAGDSYTTQLKKAHLEWGSHRKSPTRDIIYGEGYLHIPAYIARDFNIYNSNKKDAITIYNCSSKDGYLKNVELKASGSSKKENIYAKQFQGSNHLKLLGKWFEHIQASEGDIIQINWINSTDIEINKL